MTNAPANQLPIVGDIIKYKRDGQFEVIGVLDDGKFEITTDKGKFAGKVRKVQLDENTVIVEAAPRPEPVEEAPVEEAQEPHVKDECEDLDACQQEHLKPKRKRAKKAAAKKGEAKAPERKKAELPDGLVTPYELVAHINATGRYQGGTDGLKTQSIYQYRYAARDTEDPFPEVDVNGRLAVKLDDGLAWWDRKNARAQARRDAAEAKKAAKAERAAARAKAKEDEDQEVEQAA